MAIAPSVIQEAMVQIVDGIPGAVYAGIVGDVNHSFGYHLAPEDLPSGDYSRQLARDREGVEGNAASALDITNRTPELFATTARLRAAAKAGDPRLYGLREFAGTLDGVTTYNFDLSTGREGFGVWDSSHLFHNHLSGYRDCTRNRAAWLAIADVMIGASIPDSALTPTPPRQDDDMPTTILQPGGRAALPVPYPRAALFVACDNPDQAKSARYPDLVIEGADLRIAIQTAEGTWAAAGSPFPAGAGLATRIGLGSTATDLPNGARAVSVINRGELPVSVVVGQR